MNFKIHLNHKVAIALLLVGSNSLESAESNKVDFAKQILPILSNKCFACHGPDSKKPSELRLDSYQAATADRDGTKAIDPKDLSESEILFRIHDEEDPMPPLDAEKQLTDSEKSLLSSWISSGGQYAKHWAFVLPIKEKGKTNIDQFVGEKLKEQEVDFSSEAPRSVLARRAALVLTGLPPEPQQLSEFLADKKPGAYERYVDSLLSSSRYGEHQARYWLDAVRYGDTHGLHLDNKRGIFPYRDWVIKAFNNNLPFDKFITWQLAGDLLPEPTLEQRVATGFVRMNPTTAEGGAIPKEFQAKNSFDRTENFGTVMLGSTMTCARCHTHKYDPVEHVEYYQLLAFFNSTSEGSMDGNRYEYAPVLKAPSNGTDWAKWASLEKERDNVIQNSIKLVSAKSLPGINDLEEWSKIDKSTQIKQIADPNGPWKSHNLHARTIELNKSIEDLQKTFTTTLVAQELPKPRETRILERGEYNMPIGDPLEPDVPAVMGSFPEGAPKNRLGLAQWLTSRDQPLVSRVLINRVWQRTFGYGLVRTPEDFGLQGEQPTHPELLDWLALEFQDSGWDLKHMLKLMVHSRTFKQDSKIRKELQDPDNRLLARGQTYRLDAEVIRDIGLWAGNILNDRMGGEGVKPYQPDGLWSALMHPASNTKKYVRDKNDKIYQRSIYVYWKRTSPHPMMTLFDAPDRESSCVMRSRSNTALQSLGLLNETQRVEMSRKLAERLIKSTDSDERRLDLLYGLVSSRKASVKEKAACLNLVKNMRERYKDSEQDATELVSAGDAPRDQKIGVVELAAWTQLTTIVLASDAAILIY
ncbi:MAG: PSD1 and planctomycete cytochrome C domain-containing protein [Verrucomicrobiales bacterium]|nr:PSD1 and planctomycete cytochrome C domain-containing protein [Verrucomicrobiota bacterium]